MINYASAVNVLNKAGYRLTNKCDFDGQIYHDFNSRKFDASVSLVIDATTGSVARAEITTRKWSDATHRYEPKKENIYGLQELIDKFTPKKEITL